MSFLSGTTEQRSTKPKPVRAFQIKTHHWQAERVEGGTEAIHVRGACKQALGIAGEGGDWVSKSPARHRRTPLSAVPLSRGRVGRYHVEVWPKPGRLPRPSLSLTLNSVICCSRLTMNCWTQGSLAS